MKRYSLDTNILLRYLLKDIPNQVEIIRRYFIQAKVQKINLYISVLVFSEVLFTLISFYKRTKEETAKQLYRLISIPYLDIEKRETLLKALLMYKKSSLSFIDVYLVIEANSHGMEVVTFDKKLQKLAKSLTQEV